MSSSSSAHPDLTALVARLRNALGQRHATYLFLCGPPGAGKTTLATRAAREIGCPLHHFSSTALVSSTAGDSEPTIEASFEAALAAAPAVLLIENIDAAAPASPSGPADLRALAALDAAMDRVALDPERGSGLVLLATASYPGDVHPLLLRPGRFARKFRLRPPDWARRRAIVAESAGLDGREAIAGEVDAVLDDLASLTPGFLPADLESLVSAGELEISSFRSKGEEAPSDSRRKELSLSLFRAMLRVVHSIRPSLLTSAGGSWNAIPWRLGATEHLRGLCEQINDLSVCIRGTFGDRTTPSGVPPSSRRALNVLGGIRGLVLHGVPGSGKSVLANAAPSFLRRGAVNAFRLDSAEIVGAVIGVAEQKLRSLFVLARAAAPTIMVLENIEVLAPRRSDLESVAGSSGATFRRILSTFLVELDGLGEESPGEMPVFLIGTTRDIGNVDKALLRPGRLEKHIELSLPDEAARFELLSSFCSQSAAELLLSDSGSKPPWLLKIAKSTEGWSAAEIGAVCDEAVLRKVRGANLSRGAPWPERPAVVKLVPQDFVDVFETLRESSPKN